MEKGVLITGASDRIGKSLAIFFAKKHYKVAIHYAKSLEKAQITQNELIKIHGVQCELFQADFDNENEVHELIDRVNAKFSINCLINNASDFYENSFSDAGTAHLRHFFDVNFKAPYILSKKFSQLAGNDALIINILDTNIRKNKTKYFDYLLSKKFLEVFTVQLAVELAPEIRVNGIAPGIILPPPGKDKEYIRRIAQNIPAKQAGNIENIIMAVDYLINNQFVTGEILFVDGGEHL
ncbi:MAG: SDR family oxidoreductase [Bacteroidales bacterium]|nr:SDR family oxidoreductase [Bacteroidales bacterium]